jgi:signal transduction histidine kinase/ActR/RegA family two-component response regulator
MTDGASTASTAADMRVLVVAPTQRDGEITEHALTQAGLVVRLCSGVGSLGEESRSGAAAVVLTDDVLDGADPVHLANVVDAQPEWSELPFVVLARGGNVSSAVAWLQERTSVTLLERSVHLRTLISAVQMAVRARRRQYQVRDLLRAERHARIEADRANAAKDRFLAVLSHELRTPLTPIVFAVASLQHLIPESSPARRTLEMIGRNASLEAKLIDDLLDLSRVVQGKLQLQKAMVDLHDKVRDTWAMVEHDARAKGVTMRMSLDATAAQMFADPARIQQVLWNLAKNAIKFTPSGGTVSFATSNDTDRFVLSCSDTGIGMGTDILDTIFEPFQQGGEHITKSYGGLGLGLAVSRSLVEAHGGTLVAASHGPGTGATFTMTLPHVVTRVLRSDGRSGMTAPDEDAPTPVKILLVEDHQDTAQALVEALRARGHDVRQTRTVADALRAASSERFDVVISDIGLPDGSGLDLMRQIAKPPSIGAIALSGFGMEDDQRRSLAAGFARHLTKPVDVRHVDNAIRELQRHAAESKR